MKMQLFLIFLIFGNYSYGSEQVVNKFTWRQKAFVAFQVVNGPVGRFGSIKIAEDQEMRLLKVEYPISKNIGNQTLLCNRMDICIDEKTLVEQAKKEDDAQNSAFKRFLPMAERNTITYPDGTEMICNGPNGEFGCINKKFIKGDLDEDRAFQAFKTLRSDVQIKNSALKPSPNAPKQAQVLAEQLEKNVDETYLNVMATSLDQYIREGTACAAGSDLPTLSAIFRGNYKSKTGTEISQRLMLATENLRKGELEACSFNLQVVQVLIRRSKEKPLVTTSIRGNSNSRQVAR
jgi:hypothetical protein